MIYYDIHPTITYQQKSNAVLAGTGEREANNAKNDSAALGASDLVAFRNFFVRSIACNNVKSASWFEIRTFANCPGRKRFQEILLSIISTVSLLWQNYTKEKIILRFGCFFKDWWFTEVKTCSR